MLVGFGFIWLGIDEAVGCFGKADEGIQVWEDRLRLFRE
jgi:hypothetical protein